MMDLSHAGKLNVFWFLASLVSVALAMLEVIGFWPPLPSVIEHFYAYLLSSFILINVLLYLLYQEFMYATTLRSSLLGHVFAIGLYTVSTAERPWGVVGSYLCVLSSFHFTEFLSIAWCNTNSLSVSSFILNHSQAYWIALAASWIEFVAEAYLLPVTKEFTSVSWLGLALCILGEVLRKTAMFTASRNFNHLVQSEKEESHELIKHGVYAWSRHPSYVGWFIWSIATQLLLMNPVCLVAYTVVSWRFFKDRIMIEEYYLLNFFKDEYKQYQEDVPTGIPFIQGFRVNSHLKDS